MSSFRDAYREFTGKTPEEALRAARDEFGVDLNELDFEILTPGSRGVLGMGAEPARVLALLAQRGGAIRRSLASSARLKYNPQLFFALDPSADLNDRIERLLQPNEKHELSAS